jgi:hypothetical protein
MKRFILFICTFSIATVVNGQFVIDSLKINRKKKVIYFNITNNGKSNQCLIPSFQNYVLDLYNDNYNYFVDNCQSFMSLRLSTINNKLVTPMPPTIDYPHYARAEKKSLWYKHRKSSDRGKPLKARNPKTRPVYYLPIELDKVWHFSPGEKRLGQVRLNSALFKSKKLARGFTSITPQRLKLTIEYFNTLTPSQIPTMMVPGCDSLFQGRIICKDTVYFDVK